MIFSFYCHHERNGVVYVPLNGGGTTADPQVIETN